MAHRASLVLGGLVMGRSDWPLRREGVTLQAEQVYLTDAQVAWIIRAVGRVTTVTTFGFHRHMLIDKRTLFIGVAFDTDRIPSRYGSYLTEGRGAVSIVAVSALRHGVRAHQRKTVGVILNLLC